ncbi:MAG: glycosyltransferase, partial [Proteobacteria bacterium]|nr:glycosyltransferase [Pseudomonadota bacterium]
RVTTIPNAVDIPERKPVAKEPTLLFLGSYSYHPNVTAAEFLIQKVMPIIRQVIPEVSLIIAGLYPDNIRFYHNPPPNVEFTGFVRNLDVLYQRSRVVCCPIMSGGGTRVKIIEAAAYAKPIVSTRIGAEGLKMRNGKELLISNDPKSIADACIRLLKDNNLCTRLGNAARAIVKKHYSRDNIIRMIKQHLNEALR